MIKKIIQCLLVILFQLVAYYGSAQNVGIGTTVPQGEFHVTQPFTYSGIAFTGVGSNDINVNYGSFNGLGTKYFIVEITNAGPTPNILKWSNNGGVTWTENVQASTTPISVGYGVTFNFISTSGHAYGDRWSWHLLQAYPDGLVVKLGNTALGHTNPTQRLDVAGGVKADSLEITHNAGVNKVLVSDATGKAKWKPNATLQDANGDTKIEVERTADEDSIHFSISGLENWVMTNHRIEPRNAGNSIYLGKMAGNLDDLTANENIGIGLNALRNSNTGYNNVAIGTNVLETNASGYQNISIGDSSLYANTSGRNNLAIGEGVLRNNSTGILNIGIGRKNLYENLSGQGNIALGYHSQVSNTNGSNNISIGNIALGSNIFSSDNIAIGYGALENFTGTINIGIGAKSLHKSSGFGCIGIGYNACRENTNAWYTTGIGYFALYNNTTGEQNTALGVSALFSNTSGRDNCAFGAWALQFGNSNNYNTAIGSHSLSVNSTGDNNTAVGYGSSWSNSTGHDNCAIGYQSSNDCTTGNYNTSVGSNALIKNMSGSSNVAMGMQSLYNTTSTDGNVGIGLSALYATTGGFNTGIGYNAGGTGSFTHTVSVGASSSNTASYQVRIGNSSITSIGGYAGWSNLSDKRFKTNIQHNVPGLDFINKLDPITYTVKVDELNDFLHVPDSIQNLPTYKQGFEAKAKEIQSGFIAQDVEQAANQLGFYFSGVDTPKNENDLYGLRYAEFTVPLVKAVQELSAENKYLKEKIIELESKMNNVIAVMESLKK